MRERIQVSDVAQINELLKEYAAAATVGDMERWISLWIKDGIQMSPGKTRRQGKEMIQSGMQTVFDLFEWQMVIFPDEIQVLADQAYAHGSFELTMAPKGEVDLIELDGKFLTILRRQIDGLWKIAIDCFNFDAPPG